VNKDIHLMFLFCSTAVCMVCWTKPALSRLSSALNITALSFISFHSRCSAVSWRSDLHGIANTQQLRRQNFCSRWTSLVELPSGPAAQYRHHLRTVQTTAEGIPFHDAWTRRSV